MNAKYKNLYQEIVSRDMTDLDEDLFYNEYSTNDEKFANLYSYLESEGLTSLDPPTFKSEYFGANTVEKKNPDVTELPSETGSSERFTDQTTKDPVRDSRGRAESNEWFGFDPDKQRYTEGPNKGLTYADVYSNSGTYILESNPGVLYKKNGQNWLKQIGGRYLPLTKNIEAREKILNEQAVKASQFQIDRIKTTPKEVKIEYGSVSEPEKLTKKRWEGATVSPINQLTPTNQQIEREKEEDSDLKMPETKIEPATFEGKLYILEEGKDNEDFYKNPVTAETFTYWLDETGKPRKGLDPVKSQEAVNFAKKLIGEPEMLQLSKINKLDKINLNVPSADKFLNKEFYNSNFSFEQDGNQLIINSYLPEAKNNEGDVENTISIDLSSKNSGATIKQFLRDNLFYKVDVDRLNEAPKNTEKYIDFILSSSSKLKMTDDRKNKIREWQQQESLAIDADIQRNDLSNLDKEIKLYESAVLSFNKKVTSGKMSQEDFDKENDNISSQYKKILQKQEISSGLLERTKRLEEAQNLLEITYPIDAKGSILGSQLRTFVESVVATPLKTGLDISLAVGNLMMGNEKFAKFMVGDYGVKKARGLTDAEIANSAQAAAKELNIGLTELGLGLVTGTNEEYYQDPNNSLIFQALNAVTESVGTAVTGAGSKLLTTAAFFALSYNAMEDKMRGLDFDHLSENEKKLISVPYGLVIGQMEKFGFNVAAGAGRNPLFNKFANSVITTAFKSLPKNAGLVELNSAIRNNIGASIAKGLIKVVGGSSSEAIVEFSEQIFEGVEKFAVNEILKNDNFNEEYFKDAPDLTKAGGISSLIDQGWDAFKLGFLAGGMTTGGSMVKNNIVDIRSNNKFDIYKNLVLHNQARAGWIASIKEDQKSGTISFEEMNNKIDEINRSYSTLIKIPASLTTQSQREAFSLLQERENIENEIKDKEPNLVVKETNRIKEINEALKTTSENATKEDNIEQQEGTAEGGISEYQGTGEGQQEGGVSQGGQRETTINEADSSDSTVASKVQQEEQVATYRAEEQAELLEAIPKIESYKVNGEIDKTLMPKTVLAKYNSIYNKYDNLISPLLETTGEVAIDKPIITTNTTAEVSRVKSLTPESEDGATFNIDGTKYEGVGLVVPVDSMNTTTEQLTPEMVADFVAERQEMIGDAGVVKAGIYKFPNSNQVSIDLSVVVPETSREQALEFARLAGQESLFDLATFENIKTGATGENPMSFSPEQHREISKALKEGRMPNVFGTTAEITNNLLTKENIKEVEIKQTTPKNKLIVKAAKMVLNAIPGVKIYMHNNGQEMASAIESSKKELTKEEKTGLTESSGLYVDGDIHINLESATIGTVYHEAFHALIEKNGTKSGSILLMAKGLKNIISDKGVKQRLDDFVSQYNEDEKAEEYISELGGILSEAEQELTTTKLQQFKTLINNIAKKLGLPVIFSASATAQDAADFINTMSKKLRTGEEIENIVTDGIQLNVVNPTGIKKQIEFKNDYKLSFVKKEDIINIEELIKNISESGQKVWFWMADQLGRGYVFDEVSGEEHYLDAGPSFALDPKNKSKRIIWASGKTAKDIQKLINNSDYIFLVSGNPETAKLFNKAVFDLYTKKLGDYNSFKKEVLSNKPRKEISEVLNAHDSWETLREDSSTDNTKTKKIGTGRKKFLMVLNDVVNKPNATLNKILKDKNAIIDINSIRDDFYADNGFKQNDIMLVLKAEKLGGKSDHSTYENDLIGDVVGVPDKKINAYDILSDEDKVRYKDASNSDRNKQQAITAPYGSGIRNVQPSKIKFQKNKTDKITAPVAGNKLFNEPLKQALDIAKLYMKSIGKEYSPVEKITKIDEDLSKRISDAYDKMKDDPTDPEVKAAYEAMAKETLDQYDAITAKGYKLEINNNEPYSSSEDMINDLRDNNRMKIFSTESGFGDTPITEKQREENILLKDSGRKDANGETLLVNDVFRFVHDFFGHAKLGNSFGPIGEENAWRVHSEMYSPEAKKAMTSETRGQNSFVNFSGVNDAAFKKREKARQLRKEGKIDQANQLVGEVYDEMKFADQKVGLLPSFAVEEGAPSKIKFQKTTTKTEAIQNAKDIYEKSFKRFKDDKRAIANAVNNLEKSKWYRDADDMQREDAVMEIKAFFGEKIKKAPSVDKILGTPKPSMVTVKEKTALKDQIKLEARAAREAKVDLNEKRKLLSTAIKGLVKLGKLNTRQAGIIIERVGYVNLDNQAMVDRLADYAAKVFEKADYKERLSRAFSFKKGIRRLLKGDIQPEVVGMAKKFSKVDPSMVDDIEKYIEMAKIVKNAIKPSRINRKEGNVNMRESMNIDSVSEFTNDAIENQEAILKEELLAVHSELVEAGVIDKSMSLSDIESIISTIKEKEEADTPEEEEKIREFLSNRIDTMSTTIKDIIRYNINPMTFENVALTEKNRDLMSRMLNIDINNLSIKETIFIAEAMDNFINNNITSSVEAVIEKQEGATELENLIADKVVASPLRKYFINKLGQYMSEQIASMPILFEKLFVGAKNGLMVAKKMGWTALINGANKAEKMFNTTVDVYFKQYSKTKPNGKSFNDAENVYERGMLAFLSRNVSGTVTQQAEELKRRVEVLKESVKSLLEGSTKEQKMGVLYQKIYDKLNVDSRDIDIISANVDKINRSAVGWWINQWGTTYNDLADISLSVYNTMLSSDTSYSTDRYKLLDKVKRKEIIEPKNVGAFGRDIEFLDKNKTGVLIESNRPSASKVSKASRYVSLDFDVNNTSAYKGALIDINTAAAIRRIDGFINSDNLAKLIPTKEDRDIFTGRIADYIQAAKNKRVGPSDTSGYLDQLTNFLGGIGVGKALGGIDQIVKQTLPIALSTFTNSGRLDILNPASNAWIDSLGMAISNRGQESQSTIESIDRRLDKANSGAKVVSNFIVDAQQIWLKLCLSKPDIFIAKSSFISYYKQYLSNNNQRTDIDWATHNVNQDAADYAMLMVDRQQNVSDAKMAGKAFSSQNSTTKVMRKIFLPFASFSLNQKSRMVSDIKVLGINSGASKQDKIIAARSLLSLPLEMLLYQSIGLAIRLGYLAIAKGIIGAVADDDDEEKEKLLGMEMSKEMKNATKYPLKSMVTDFLSPIAIADHAVVGGANYLLSQLSVDQDMIDEAVSKKNIMLKASGKEKMNDKEKQNFIEKYKEDHEYQLFNDEKKSYGTIGIGGDTYKELIDNMNTAYTGKYTQDYMGNESERFLLPKDQDNIKNAVIFETLFALGILPRDVNTVTNNIIKLSKKNSLTENQFEKYKAVGKETGGKVTGWKMDLVESKSKTESTLEELDWIKGYGGLTEKQGQEYVKLKKLIVGHVSYTQLMDLQSGMTADKIIKSY